MKLRLNRQELADAMSAVSAIASPRSPKEVLKGVLLRALPDRFEAEGNDGEIGLRCMLSQVEVEKPGELLLPAAKLSDIARESSDETLLIESEGNTCHVRGGDSHFQIVAGDAGDFPAMADTPAKVDFEISAKALRRLAECTVFAVARESTRYALNGVLWERARGKLALVATDGRRLAMASSDLASTGKKAESEQTAIVPGKAMTLMQKLLASDEDMVGVSITSNQIVLRWPRAMICSPQVDGHFPRYRDVIPVDNDKSVELRVSEMVSAVRRAALLTNEESRGVRFAFEPGQLALSSRAPQEGEARVTLPIEYGGEAIEIGFNPHFLIDVLRIVHTDTVTFEMHEANRPGVLRCGSDFLYVIMPVNLS